jgi:hypothetical protein
LLRDKAGRVGALRDVGWVVGVVGNLFREQRNVLKSMRIAREHD